MAAISEGLLESLQWQVFCLFFFLRHNNKNKNNSSKNGTLISYLSTWMTCRHIGPSQLSTYQKWKLMWIWDEKNYKKESCNLSLVGSELPCYLTVTYIARGKILISLTRGGRVWGHYWGSTLTFSVSLLSDKEVDWKQWESWMGVASVGHCTSFIHVLLDTPGRLGGGSPFIKEKT